MHNSRFTQWHRFFLIGAIFLLSSAAVYPQKASAISGRWSWKQVARKHKPQIQLTIVIAHKKEAVSGTYSVDEFIDGKWQGEDGNQTPFRGRVKGSTIEIEFDPTATVAGYEEHVTYSAPSDGRKPSTALITISGPGLQWKLITGPGIDGVPASFVLKREPLRPTR